LRRSKASLPPGTTNVHVCIRADDVILLKGADLPSSARNHLTAIVRSIAPEGTLIAADLDCGFQPWRHCSPDISEEISLKPATAWWRR